MEVAVRQAKREDAQQMLQVYNNFTKQFVGPASRTIKNFKTMLRRRDRINWVALDNQNRIIGYAHARLDKRLNRGDFGEMVIDSKHDLEQVARPLVEKVNSVLTEKKVSVIVASSVRNPVFEKLFPRLGFFESESNDLFMYAILNVQKFLDGISAVFVNRLKQLGNWNGSVQIECEGHSVFLQKTGEDVQSIVWANQPVDFKITPTRELFIKLVFGLVDPADARKIGQLKVETGESQEKINRLLMVLFPKRQFLIMDHW